MQNQTKKGFTLLEILLVVGAISILAGIVIVAINPTKQLGDTRNAQRRADVNTILNAIYQYSVDTNGAVPGTITANAVCDDDSATKQICKAGATGTCSTGENLTVLTTDAKYLTALPVDPTTTTGDGTGYYAVKDVNNRITVCAPNAEGAGITISATR